MRRKNKINTCLIPQSGSEERVHGDSIGCALSAPKLWEMFSESEKKIWYWDRKNSDPIFVARLKFNTLGSMVRHTRARWTRWVPFN